MAGPGREAGEVRLLTSTATGEAGSGSVAAGVAQAGFVAAEESDWSPAIFPLRALCALCVRNPLRGPHAKVAKAAKVASGFHGGTGTGGGGGPSPDLDGYAGGMGLPALDELPS